MFMPNFFSLFFQSWTTSWYARGMLCFLHLIILCNPKLRSFHVVKRLRLCCFLPSSDEFVIFFVVTTKKLKKNFTTLILRVMEKIKWRYIYEKSCKKCKYQLWDIYLQWPLDIQVFEIQVWRSSWFFGWLLVVPWMEVDFFWAWILID